MSIPDTTDLGAPPPEFAPEPPPRGPLVWMKENLFSTPPLAGRKILLTRSATWYVGSMKIRASRIFSATPSAWKSTAKIGGN